MTTWEDRPDRFVVLPPEPVGRPWRDWLEDGEGRSMVQPISPFVEEPESWLHVLAGLLLLAGIVWLLVAALPVLLG